MSYTAATGATCLGAVIGWLVRYFIRRFDRFGPAALGSVISIILGGAAVKFLEADRSVWWFYPIGLFVGFVIYQLIVSFDGRGGGGGGQSGGGNPLGPLNWDIKSNPRWFGRW
jgi:hypothetical protein